MLIEFFLERSRIELSADGLTYSGRLSDLPTIHVTAASPEQCRQKLAAAVTALLASEARHNAHSEAENATADNDGSSSGYVAGNEADEKEIADSPVEQKFSDVIYEKKDWVARVTINRPEAYNAYTDRTLREMAAAFRAAASDDRIAVLVLTGTGDRAFSAGGDVQQHCDEHVGNAETFRKWMSALIEAHDALRQLGKPSIARINGIVAGGGNDWNLACDLAIAADHSKFVQIETKVGLVSGIIASHWLPLVVGERRAREIVLTGDPISANKALLWGLVNDVVPYKQLDKSVDSLCARLIDRFPESTRVARSHLSFWKDLAWDSMIRTMKNDLALHMERGEAITGLRALSQKQEVDYRTFRANSNQSNRHSIHFDEITDTADQKDTSSRSCYSCGAQGIPQVFDYCGLCGKKLV